MDAFMEEIVKNAKKSMENLEEVEEEHVEVVVKQISCLARIQALRVIDIWLEVATQFKSKNNNELVKKLMKMRFQEMEESKLASSIILVGDQNEFLYAHWDLREVLNQVSVHKDKHKQLRIEHWYDGLNRLTEILDENGSIKDTISHS